MRTPVFVGRRPGWAVCEVFLLETFVAFNIKRCGNPCNISIHIYSKFMSSSKASPTHTLRFILSEPLPVLPLGYAGCRWCKSSSASLEASTDNLRRLNRARFELQSTCIDQIDHLLDVHQASCWSGIIYIYIHMYLYMYIQNICILVDVYIRNISITIDS